MHTLACTQVFPPHLLWWGPLLRLVGLYRSGSNPIGCNTKKKKAEKDAQGGQQHAQMSGQGQLQAPSSHQTKSLIESSDLVGHLTPTW